jgi:hypothetical protein
MTNVFRITDLSLVFIVREVLSVIYLMTVAERSWTAHTVGMRIRILLGMWIYVCILI